MSKEHRFAFRANDEDRALLDVIAQRLQRTRSDAVRWLIRSAVLELNTERSVKPFPKPTQQPEVHADV